MQNGGGRFHRTAGRFHPEQVADFTEIPSFTPAQIQEVLHGMVIARSALGEDTMQFNHSDVDSTIVLLNIRRTGTIGFNSMLCPKSKQ